MIDKRTHLNRKIQKLKEVKMQKATPSQKLPAKNHCTSSENKVPN
ncbi:MAG: hypothetical protein ACD_16C00221G0001 [uncultured bacterium]|nr:MAG: hypothetical protein ACD_16C00221G0001 [uncultured bacterium]